MKKLIVVKFQFEGVHHWPDCNIKEVYFLGNPHRHLFHVTATKKVEHENREIEIIRFKRRMLEWVNETYKGQLGAMSCESIASKLLKVFSLDSCVVLEDGENGAMVTI